MDTDVLEWYSSQKQRLGAVLAQGIVAQLPMPVVSIARVPPYGPDAGASHRRSRIVVAVSSLVGTPNTHRGNALVQLEASATAYGAKPDPPRVVSLGHFSPVDRQGHVNPLGLPTDAIPGSVRVSPSGDGNMVCAMHRTDRLHPVALFLRGSTTVEGDLTVAGVIPACTAASPHQDALWAILQPSDGPGDTDPADHQADGLSHRVTRLDLERIATHPRPRHSPIAAAAAATCTHRLHQPIDVHPIDADGTVVTVLEPEAIHLIDSRQRHQGTSSIPLHFRWNERPHAFMTTPQRGCTIVASTSGSLHAYDTRYTSAPYATHPPAGVPLILRHSITSRHCLAISTQQTALLQTDTLGPIAAVTAPTDAIADAAVVDETETHCTVTSTHLDGTIHTWTTAVAYTARSLTST